jgi:hypothetical protein
MKFLISMILFLIPRFVTDRVALARCEHGELCVYCLESDVENEDKTVIESYGTINTFTWLGFAAGGKVTID